MITFVIPMHKWTDQSEVCFNRLHQQVGNNEIILVADQCELPDLPAKIVKTTKR